MKKIKLVLMTTFLIALFFTACEKKDGINNPVNDNFESAQYTFIDVTDLTNGIEPATLDNQMDFNPDLFNYDFIGKMGDFKPGMGPMHGEQWFDKFDFDKHFGMIFKRLNLSDEQKTSIRGFVKSYHDAVKPLVKNFRDSNKEIVDSANVKRKAILDDLKNGLFSREEARNKLQLLNDETKTKIQNNPASITIKQQMCTERKKLIDNISSVLTPEQLDKWTTYILNLKNPCQ